MGSRRPRPRRWFSAAGTVVSSHATHVRHEAALPPRPTVPGRGSLDRQADRRVRVARMTMVEVPGSVMDCRVIQHRTHFVLVGAVMWTSALPFELALKATPGMSWPPVLNQIS